MLHLGPVGMGSIGGDESDVTIKRWVLKLLLPSVLVMVGFTYRQIDNRFAAIEVLPSTSVQVQLMDQRLAKIEKIIAIYEDLRVVRERQVTELQTQQRNIERKIDEINTKLDRLLYGRRLPLTGAE